MSCSMIAAEMPVDRTTEVTVSMIGVFSRVLTPLVGSSRNRSFGRSAYAMATSRSLRSPCETPPASIRAFPSSPKRRRISSASSHTARSALASEASRRVLPAREKIVSATLSSTVSWSKRFTSWKLRAIPARMRPCTDSRVTSWPRNRMRPLSGGKSPEIRLTSVVLPAPLEPISASTSRSLTVKSTWSTAWVSPKYLTRFFVTSRLTSAPLLPARGEPARGADDPGGQREHEHHQHGPEEELPVHRVADRVGLEVVEHDRADDGTRERPEAAEHGHEDHLAREAPVDDVGRREAVQRHPERPREPGEHTRDQEGHEAVAPDLDADELRARLVVADRLERLAEGRVHDHPHEDDAGEEDDEHVVVVRVRHEVGLVPRARGEPRQERRRRHPEAVGAAGHPEELERERPEHLRERERQDTEEDARVPYTHEPEHRGDDDRADDRPEKEQLHRADPEVLDHQRDDVGAHPEIRGMAEREESRVSEKQVEAERRDRHDQPVREQDRRVLRDDPRHDEQDHGDRKGPAEDVTERSGLARVRGRGHGRRAHGRPNSPAGRTSRTIAAMR